MEKPVVALILARGNSKGIPLKNLSIVGNKTLIRRSVEAAKNSQIFNSVWISTDNEDIAEEGQSSGANIYYRSHIHAQDNSTSFDAVLEFLQHYNKAYALCLIQSTSPFIKPEYLITGAKLIMNGYDSVFSVTRTHALRWKECSDGSIEPINFEPSKRPRRQDWAGELVENGMFYFTKISHISNGFLQGGKCGFVEIPLYESIEIDEPADLKLANVLVNMGMLSENVSKISS